MGARAGASPCLGCRNQGQTGSHAPPAWDEVVPGEGGRDTAPSMLALDMPEILMEEPAAVSRPRDEVYGPHLARAQEPDPLLAPLGRCQCSHWKARLLPVAGLRSTRSTRAGPQHRKKDGVKGDLDLMVSNANKHQEYHLSTYFICKLTLINTPSP